MADVSDEELAELLRVCSMGPPVLSPPTTAELERILQSPDPMPVNIQPDGSITAGPPTLRVEVAKLTSLITELQARRAAEAKAVEVDLPDYLRFGEPDMFPPAQK